MAALSVIGVAGRAAPLDLAAALTTPLALTGDTFPAGYDIFLRVKSTGTACVPTVMSAAANAGPRGTFLAQLALPTTGTTGDKLYGPFPADTFADPSDGLVHLSYSATTGVTVGVYRMSQS